MDFEEVIVIETDQKNYIMSADPYFSAEAFEL